MLQILEAHGGQHLNLVRALFEEYAASLGISLDFQNFEEELDELPGGYAPPAGCLLLALWQSQPAGCVAMQKIDEHICEMTRLYVKSQYQGLRIGKALAETVIQQARAAGYSRMRLDALPNMQRARTMYAALGFRAIAPYRHNPVAGTAYMELMLT